MKNFRNISSKYNIQIPIIQRDYAQGRTDKKTNVIRDNFLNSIADVLKKNNKLHLDFIYGSIHQNDVDQPNKFIPLDGQQRLTTLFLLHWYFGKKENKDISYLNSFTYETRASSREFCNKLVGSVVDFLSSITLSNQIKDSSWFLAYWENDPTVKAMLIMIDSIHSKFQSDFCYEYLDNITFNFFELENFGLDDDLYIKMNARGKPLTDFENFKAKFEKYLSEYDITLKNDFSIKIDNIWTDFFWGFAVNDKSYLIDSFFMNYFFFITELLYYCNNKEVLREEITFNHIKSIYASRENIVFLFSSLDILPSVQNCFKEIFSKSDYSEGKVTIFDNDINLLEKIITGQNINIQQKILLFLIIKHLTVTTVNDNLKDLLRVSRNLLTRIRHRKRGFIYYTGDLSYEHVYYVLKLFLSLINKDIYKELSTNTFDRSNTGISEQSFQDEVEKAILINNIENIKHQIFRLEDYKYLKGDIHNFFKSDISELVFLNDSIREIYSKDDSSIIRAMLTVNDFSINIGWSSLGDKKFFGKKNYWEVILTSQDNINFYSKFIEAYKINDKSLDKIIIEYLKSNKTFDWEYYFIKYPHMTSVIPTISSDNNIYAWYNDFSLEKMGGSNLNAYHLNPYIFTASEESNVISSVVQFDSPSYLEINQIKIFSTSEGWKIKKLDKTIYSNLITKYNLTEKESYYILKETAAQDRIEVLKEFIISLDRVFQKTRRR